MLRRLIVLVVPQKSGKANNMTIRIAAIILAALLCTIFAAHAALVLNAIVGFLVFISIIGYLFLSLAGRKSTQNSTISAPRIAALVAASCIAVQYVFIFTTGTLDNKFIIGDSDSLLYHNIAAEMANSYKLSELVTSLDLVQQTADKFGHLIPNLGMYWFLGVIYTIVGIKAGPGTYLFVNVFCAMAIAYYSTLIAVVYAKNKISNYSAVLFSVLIFFNGAISNHAFHLRKDFLLVALLIAAIYYGVARRWILFVVLVFFALQLRAIFLIVFAIPVFYSLNKFIPKLTALSPGGILKILFILVVVIAILPRSLFSLIGMASGDSDPSVLWSLSIALKGSSFFANNEFFQWIYVIFYPFPPMTPSAYLTMEGLVSLLIFSINCYLLFWILAVARKSAINGNEYSLLISVWSVLFLLLLINLVSASATGLFGVVEPRYKFALWVFSGIIMMVYKNNKYYSVSKAF